jgi:hypothetical protein
MALEPIELGRLAIMQRYPLRYFERRVEHLSLTDDHHYSVAVTQQFVVPSHAEGDAQQNGKKDLLVPLGQFAKDRMPDLRATDADGATLPFLTLLERAQVGQALFASRWQNGLLGRVAGETKNEASDIWRIIQFAVGQIVTGGRPAAYLAIYRLKGYLVEMSRLAQPDPDLHCFLLAILAEDEFWEALRSLAETRLMVGRMRGVPGRTYVVNVGYTERFRYRGYAKTSASGLVRKGLAWLGLIGIPVARSVANLGQTAALWIVQSVPEGIEPLRCYWKKNGHVSRAEVPVSVDISRAVAERHQEPGEKPQQDVVLLDVQLSPSSAIVATIALAAMLLVVSTYVYQALPGLRLSHHDEDRTVLVGLGSIFAAVPAAIAGALAYKGQTFVQRASRGPRTLLAILSAAAAFFAAVVSLKDLGALTEVVAFSLSIYSLIVIGIFAFIQLGPRWRKNERSRMKSATVLASPSECRQKQIRDALIWLGFWTLVVLVFARSQAVLQHRHFFTNQFPANVWRSWWSWFGL